MLSLAWWNERGECFAMRGDAGVVCDMNVQGFCIEKSCDEDEEKEKVFTVPASAKLTINMYNANLATY